MTTSSASLDRSPKSNWVQEAGGLPPYVRKIARAIHEKRGIPLSQAIPFAIGRLKKWAAGGDNVTAETQAKAAAAIAAWNRLKSKAGKLTEAEALGGVQVRDENLGVPTPLLLAWIDELDDAEQLVEAALGGHDEKLHPRDLLGRFRTKVGALKVGESATLPDGRKVVKTDRKAFEGDNYHDVYDENGRIQASQSSARLAADSAATRSAQSTDPKSLGGATKYRNLDALPAKSDSKPVRDSPAGSGKSFAEGVSAAYNANAANAAKASRPEGASDERERARAYQALDPLKVGDSAKWGTLTVKRLPDDSQGRAQFDVDGKTMGGSRTISRMVEKGRATATPARANTPSADPATRRRNRTTGTVPKSQKGGPAAGGLDTTRGIFRKYDDAGLLVALRDPQLQGKNRRQAEREARARGLISEDKTPPPGAIVRGNKTYMPGDPDYERLSKIVGPPEPGSPAARSMAKVGQTAGASATVHEGRTVKAGDKVIVGEPGNVTRDVTATVTKIEGGKVHVKGPHGTSSHDPADVQATSTSASAAAAAADLRQQLKRVNATLKSGKGPQAYARRRKAEIEQQLAKLVEAATPPTRVNLRTKGGRMVNVSVAHARRIHLQGNAAADQRPGAKPPAGARDGDFESKHPRGGKGSTSGGKFVKKGSTGTEVRAIQRRVGARVDGAFGDKTAAAVRAFQQKHGLKVDGIVGKQTVAALRGRRDAKRVGTGELTKKDREYLAGHIRGTGRQTRGKLTSLVEAVTPPQFLERVQALQPGEIARLPDGGAVKHHKSEDGRDLWTAGRPTSYGENGLSWREQHRTPELAVADALSASAGSTDPASLGGPNRFGGYTRIAVNGRPARFVGVDANCSPLVRYDGASVEPVAVTWPELVLAPRLVEAHR